MNFYLSAACGLLATSMIACAPSAAPSSTPSAAASLASAAVVPPAAQPQTGVTPDAQTEARIARVVAGLLPPFYTSAMRPWSLQERMAQHQVPGLSIAVIDGGKIAWARGFGVRDTVSKVPVDAQTVFQAASVSKPIAAVAAMRLVQEGRLALDEDVNTRLRSWQVPASAQSIASPVTLRRLLTHRAGLGVPGFNGYEAGAQIPSTRQVLDGLPPANSPPVRVSFPMDGEYRYSGGGFTVIEQLVADTAEKPFARYTQDAVLKPLGMTRSAFVQPLAGELAANAAAGHDRGQALAGGAMTHPELAAAGLWTTPTDLARLALALQNPPANGSGVLSAATVRQMLSPTWNGEIGLGVYLQNDGETRFSHRGANNGFRAYWVAGVQPGQGAVVMTNSNGGGELNEEVVRAIAVEYGWRGYPVPTRPVTPAPLASAPFFLRGSMSGWAPVHLFKAASADTYAVTVALKPGRYEFKVASVDFRSLDFGTALLDPVLLSSASAPGTGVELVVRGRNMVLNVTQDENFTFTVDASKPLEPRLFVRPSAP